MLFFGILGGFLSILIATGIILARRNRSISDFFYGNREIGSMLIFFTVTASWIGASTTIATLEKGLTTGFNAIWMLGIPTFVTIFIFILLNRRIRQSGFISLPDFLKTHYGSHISIFASILVFFYMVLLAASQFVAWGRFISGMIGLDYHSTVMIGGIIVILYAFLGGYLSVVMTDGIQLVLITAAIGYLFFHSNQFFDQFQSTDILIFSNLNYHILMVLSFTLAWVISPIIWQRIISAKSERASALGLRYSLIVFFLIYMMILVAAISLRQFGVNANLGYIIQNFLPQVGQAIVFIGIASAIMSTADSALNIGALTVTTDILRIEEKNRALKSAKISTVICGMLAVLIALGFTSIIKTLGLASEIMAEGFFIPGMAALIFKIKRPMAGILSMAMGGGFAILVFLNQYGHHLPIPDWPYSLPWGLGLSGLGFLIGFYMEGRKTANITQ